MAQTTFFNPKMTPKQPFSTQKLVFPLKFNISAKPPCTSLCSSYFPHLATVAAGSAEAECELVISSLVKPTYQVQSLSFSSKIKSLISNRKLLIVSLESGQISGFHAHQNYTPVFNLDRDFPLYQTLSLGDRWLAFNEKSKWSQVCSRGGVKTFNDTSTITSNTT